MNIYRKKLIFKILIVGVMAPLIGLVSQRYTRSLVMRLQAEERSKVELWALATRQLITAGEGGDESVELSATIIENNTTVPLILTDGEGKIISSANFRERKGGNSGDYLLRELEKISERSAPIVIDLGNGHVNKIYYKDSVILRKVRWYPWIQLIVVIFFGAVSYIAFSSSRRAEENQVWVGMSRETAHQLGTPVSSLSAWLEIIDGKYPGELTTMEMQKDVERLEKITGRFSGIGSKPELAPANVLEVTENTVNYLKKRTSSRVTFNITGKSREVNCNASVNPGLYEWVVENLCRNAIDAMDGDGTISINFARVQTDLIIDFCDTGKGIPRGAFKTVFRPGYTTKKTGWGLGLSLAKRIIEDYHGGRIFVLSSEQGRGTCIRVVLKNRNSDRR